MTKFQGYRPSGLLLLAYLRCNSGHAASLRKNYMEGYPGSPMLHSSTLTDSSVSSDPCFRSEAEFLDGIQAKVLHSFPHLVIHSHLYSLFWLRFLFFNLTQPLTVSVKEKVGKPDRKSYGLRNPYRNLKS
jgi:hypothetical protein